jgi:EAL domain-containing protein (putative c-di-GMP-specific phosphodiesterase class I)
MEIVAEGVESRADWDWLREAQCDIAQGYFIARPMPAEALPEWLSQWRQRIDSEHLLPGRSTTN